MWRDLRLLVTTALILTGMVATIAAGPGRAGTLKAAGFAPAMTRIQAPWQFRSTSRGCFGVARDSGRSVAPRDNREFGDAHHSTAIRSDLASDH